MTVTTWAPRPAEAVEHRGQRRDEGLALARPHLGDLALVEGDGAHQLDVVLAHADGPLHGLAAGGEHLGDDLVEGRAQALVLALAAGLGQVAAALQVRAVELVLGRLLRLGGLEDVGPDQVDPLADLRVGEGLVLGLELVRAIDERLDPAQLAVVVVEELGEEAHGRLSIGCRAREAPDSRGRGRGRRSGAGRDLGAGVRVGHHDVAGKRLEAGVGDGDAVRAALRRRTRATSTAGAGTGTATPPPQASLTHGPPFAPFQPAATRVPCGKAIAVSAASAKTRAVPPPRTPVQTRIRFMMLPGRRLRAIRFPSGLRLRRASTGPSVAGHDQPEGDEPRGPPRTPPTAPSRWGSSPGSRAPAGGRPCSAAPQRGERSVVR